MLYSVLIIRKLTDSNRVAAGAFNLGQRLRAGTFVIRARTFIISRYER